MRHTQVRTQPIDGEVGGTPAVQRQMASVLQSEKIVPIVDFKEMPTNIGGENANVPCGVSPLAYSSASFPPSVEAAPHTVSTSSLR